MSDELKQFYREIWAWIQDGCQKHSYFRKDAAICFSLYKWCDRRNPDLYPELDTEQNNLLRLASLDSNYPFNIGYLGWAGEVDGETLYDNPARLAFIKEHAK